jgi:hypothetical protein
MHTMHLYSARDGCGNLFTNAQPNFEVSSQRWSRARPEEQGAWIFVVGDADGVRKREKLLQMSGSATGGQCTAAVDAAGSIRRRNFLARVLVQHLAANNRAASLVHTATGTIASAA